VVRVPSERPDGDGVEHFLVDGVAPPVIGGGPPESPFDLAPDPEPEPRHHAHGPTPTGPAQRGPGRPYERQEPPTSPIPVVHQLPPEPEKRKSWVSRMFGGS
jgi:hypothetical protein